MYYVLHNLSRQVTTFSEHILEDIPHKTDIVMVSVSSIHKMYKKSNKARIKYRIQ